MPSGGTRYIALNTTIKPFDNINVRKAIIAASNRNALRQTRGGAVLGDVATGWIPPGIPGFDEAGGLKQDTDLDFLKNPAGDMTVAKKYLAAAAKKGVPISNGKYTGGGKVLTIATNADPGKKTAEVAQNQIEKLGLQAELPHRPAGHAVHEVLRRPEGRRSRSARTSAGSRTSPTRSRCWMPTFNGNNILQAGNVNWPQLNDPKINVGDEEGRDWSPSGPPVTRRGRRSTR